ncbi:MAG: TonB-dependent receptor, partial [Chitinophagaceae bacterium]|nr:TonB-dependent receptor [Chitinophagaceae bacterium]
MNLSRIGGPSLYNSRDKMKKLLPLILFSVCSFALNAQSISGLIKDADEKPLANATVSLLRSKDSSVAKLAVTNKEGRYTMSGIKEGKYLLSVSHVGFAMKYSSLFDVTGTTEIEGPSL